MNFINEFLRQFSETGNLAPILAEHLLGVFITLAFIGLPVFVGWWIRRRMLAQGQIRGSLSGDLFLPIRRGDGSVLFANRTILMANMRDILPDEGLVKYLFGVFRKMERQVVQSTTAFGGTFSIGIVRLERLGVYWGVTAMLVKHLSAMNGETFLEMAAKGRASGVEEGAETKFVMALIYAKATRNWFPRLLVVQREFLLSLLEKGETDFSFAFPPHMRDLESLQALARLYVACGGDQAMLAENGLVIATVSLPTEEG